MPGVALLGPLPVVANAMAGTETKPSATSGRLDAATFDRRERSRRLAARKAACLVAVPRRRLATCCSWETWDSAVQVDCFGPASGPLPARDGSVPLSPLDGAVLLDLNSKEVGGPFVGAPATRGAPWRSGGMRGDWR